MPSEASIYRDVLEAVEAAFLAQTGAGESFEGWAVVLRKEPAFVPDLDVLPTLVISPRRGMGAIPMRQIFGKVGAKGYEVIVGNFIDSGWERERLWRRLAIRQAMELTLWNVAIAEGITSGDGFDANYQPAFFEGQAAPPHVDGDWMKVTYAIKTMRTTSEGR